MWPALTYACEDYVPLMLRFGARVRTEVMILKVNAGTAPRERFKR